MKEPVASDAVAKADPDAVESAVDQMEGDRRKMISAIAVACQMANRAYQHGLDIGGDDSRPKPGAPTEPKWSDAPDWITFSVIDGVQAALDGTTPEQSHERWMARKVDEGWVYGDVKDPEKKTHPCMVPYGQLSMAQREKDQLFLDMVKELSQVLI